MPSSLALQTKKSSRRWRVFTGVVLLQLLLMGSAFVGGRMFAQQNARTARPAGAGQLPSQLPKDPSAATGSVAKIQDTLITLNRGRAPGQGNSAASQTEVSITAETKYYKNVSSNTPGGGPAQVQVADATLGDVKIGNNIIVWGAKNGERVTAEVIYIQTPGR